MKRRFSLPDILTAAGAGILVTTLCLVFYGIHHDPAILKYPARAEARAEEFLNAVCGGDYGRASERLYGLPNLGTPPEGGSEIVSLMWDSFLDSLEYDLLGECYPEGAGVAVDAKIRFADIPAAIQTLGDRSRALLEERILAAESSRELYDENNEYRQEIVAQILRNAATQALADNAQKREQSVTLRLVYEQGQWWVLPEKELLDVLAGAFSG